MALDLGLVYHSSIDFVRANADHILRGLEGEHACATCDGDLHDNQVGKKVGYGIESGGWLGFVCIACFQAFDLAQKNHAAWRQITDIIKTARQDGAA